MPHRPATTEQDGYNAEACGCWIWTGHTDGNGVPIRRTATSNTTAARYAWEQENGKVPEGQILHKDCGTQLCVRPRHHRPVDRAEQSYLNGHSRLTPMMGKRAQRAIAKGMSKRKVAEVFNVSPRTIGRIADGSHWTVREKN
jgi:hypothetical protein